MMGPLVTVTGAAGFSGRFIAEALLDRGYEVQSLVSNLARKDPFEGRVRYSAYNFADFDVLKTNLKNVTTLVNTYWVRFNRGDINFELAINHSRILFNAAKAAGVERIIHISVANPSPDSELPYYRGKWQVERQLIEIGIPYTIIRPTLIFGLGDILINNIAYLLRRFPAFAIPGDGKYRIQPIHGEDLAEIVFESIDARTNLIMDAAGPEIYDYNEIVQMIASVVGSKSWIFHLQPGQAVFLASIIGRLLGDVIITREEIAGLMQNKLVSSQTALGKSSFHEWLIEYSPRIGKIYASELERNFDYQTTTNNNNIRKKV
jgi:uncharacterized protein YbjT (DUF2867 family)